LHKAPDRLLRVPGKRIAILQSNYVPWKGYFDLINSVDEFVVLDDAQYTKRDWRNRNKLKTQQGTAWLTIPVQVKGRYLQRIDETLVSDPSWVDKHWRAIEFGYARAPHFGDWGPRIEALYTAEPEQALSEINLRFLRAACEWLGISTPLTRSRDYAVEGTRGDRILALCQAAGAEEYVSGPAARVYLDEARFAEAGVRVFFADYAGYAEYEQLYPPFEHGVSILDLVLNTGDAAREYLKSTSDRDAILATPTI
jgi:hypothetical protein